MGFFNRHERKSLGELDLELQEETMKSEISAKRAETAEKEAIIKELKEKYGSGWKKILGVGKLVDLQTLRSFLTNAKSGMRKAGVVSPGSITGEGALERLKSPPKTAIERTSTERLNPQLNPGNFRGIRRA